MNNKAALVDKVMLIVAGQTAAGYTDIFTERSHYESLSVSDLNYLVDNYGPYYLENK